MRWRLLGATLLALVVGAGGAYAYTSTRPQETAAPIAIEQVVPVPAQSPSLPVEVFEPDPDDPPLMPQVALEPDDQRLVALNARGRPTPYFVDVPVPEGWDVTPLSPNVDSSTAAGVPDSWLFQWKLDLPASSSNSYNLRIDVVAPADRSVQAAINARLVALRSAQLSGSITNLETEQSDVGFSGSYVQAGYRRVFFERIVTGSDGLAYAGIAGTGRVEDADGLEDLVSRVYLGIRTGPSDTGSVGGSGSGSTG